MKVIKLIFSKLYNFNLLISPVSIISNNSLSKSILSVALYLLFIFIVLFNALSIDLLNVLSIVSFNNLEHSISVSSKIFLYSSVILIFCFFISSKIVIHCLNLVLVQKTLIVGRF